MVALTASQLVEWTEGKMGETKAPVLVGMMELMLVDTSADLTGGKSELTWGDLSD